MPDLRLPYRLLSGLLLTTALVAPALAKSELEVVVVTAEKKAEDAQSVPSFITAFSGADLKSKQISSFRDLNFAVPNATYSNTNLGGANFQIRGVGTASTGTEAGIAVHVNDVYLYDPLMATQSFYDIDQIEVLSGPQSTLYGRGATGGIINIITAKPDVDKFGANGELTYGNYNQTELKGMINVPILNDALAVRIAGDWTRHDGFVTNVADGAKIDGRDAYSVRGSIRWEPLDGTIIDLSASMGRQGGSQMRGQKQLCTRDPSGILGCLPDSAKTEAVNVNAQVTNTAASVQGIAYSAAALNLGPALTAFQSNLALFDLSQPVTPPPNANPANMRQVNTDFDPTYSSGDHFVSLNVKQQVTPWLEATFVGGYEDHDANSQESFNNVAPTPLDPSKLGTYDASKFVLGGKNGVLNTLAFALSSGFLPGTGPAYAANYAPFYSHPGKLPLSKVVKNGMGVISGDITGYSGSETGFDAVDGTLKQYSGELRVVSNLTGPFNFLLGANYLSGKSNLDYYLAYNTLDLADTVLGALTGPALAPSTCLAKGCVQGPTIVHLQGQDLDLESKAFFGEFYYDVIPDELKFTLGARFTDDHKSALVRAVIIPGLIPIGTQNESATLASMVGLGVTDFDPTKPGSQLWTSADKAFDSWTGRAVLNWTPKLDFTDQTMVYASYARGYKEGGFNIGQQNTPNVTATYKPEGIDALEIGTKNTLLDSELQANLSAWYYNYENLQVSSMAGNASVTGNVGARLWGVEGEFLYAPGDSNWTFNLTFGHTNSALGDTSQVDTRNPSAGRSDAVLIKDATAGGASGSNCVIYRTGTGAYATPADAHVDGFFAPPGGTTALAAHGVPLVNYGVCSLTPTTDQGKAGLAQLAAAGFSLSDPKLNSKGNDSGGVKQSVHGNEMPNTPPWTLSVGAQYDWQMDSGYGLEPRVDVAWQDSSWSDLFEDAPNRLDQSLQVNAQVTLTSPSDKWYATAFVKNATGSDAITGKYLASSIMGLYTNAFLVDPRTYGIRIGAKF